MSSLSRSLSECKSGKFSFRVPQNELNLDWTFQSGQVFRWSRNSDGSWSGPLGRTWLTFHHTENELTVSYLGDQVTPETIHKFFRLDVDLQEVFDDLIQADPRLIRLFKRFQGLRVLAQEPVECLLSFVCAVVTSIPRIHASIEAISQKFGYPIVGSGYAFPPIATLATVNAQELRVGGMEFRCRSLSLASKSLSTRGGQAFLSSLVGQDYDYAWQRLTSIPHVGRKVADCVLLFSLGFDDAFPLDTHTWRLASALYDLPLHAKSPQNYKKLSNFFREKFGVHAGWIQQYMYLFCLKTPRGADYAEEIAG